MYTAVTKLAIQAGAKILEYYKKPIQVEAKSDNSPLTQADLAAHDIISDGLKKITPNIPLISEEGGIAEYGEREKWTTFWLVDPLDGTKEFIKKNGEFTVNIALIDGGEPVLGVVYVPDMNTTYYASREAGAFKQVGDEKPRRIYSEASKPGEPLTAVQSRSHGSDALISQLEEKGLRVTETLPAGSSIKFCLVAEGRADIYPRMGPTMEWDVAAGDCVYRYSASQGAHSSPLRYNKPDLKNDSFLIGITEQ